MKYFATLGPSFNKEEDICQAIEAGLSGLRINLSHGLLEERSSWVENVKKADEKFNTKTEILLDIVGAEIRIKLDGDIFLEKEENVKICPIIDIAIDKNAINIKKEVYNAIEVGDLLSIDDGKVSLEVVEKKEDSILAKSKSACLVKNSKSMAVKGKEFDLPLLSEEDIINLEYSKNYEIKSFMIPFVRSKDHVLKIKEQLDHLGIKGYTIYSKIEDIIGISNLEEIASVSDEIVIARGDLGNKLGLVQVAKIQKEISSICRKNGFSFMVVTELLSSMIDQKTPTRAEINDIYNSTLDGASSLMVTGETAIGKYPIDVIRYLVAASSL